MTYKRRIDSYVIPKETIGDMDSLIKKTHETGLEHGMSLCADKNSNIVRSGVKSIGTETGIDISEKCKDRRQKYVGSFHTHPDDSEAASSAQDVHSSCLEMSNLDCIGKNSRGEIICLSKKEKNTSCVEDALPLKSIEDTFRVIPDNKLPKIKRDLYEEVDVLVEQKFDLHRIK